MDRFAGFITRKFREWEASTGRRQSQSAFARHLGVRQPSLSRWMTGDGPPDYANAVQLAGTLGPEVWDYVDYDHPASVTELLANYGPLPEEVKTDLQNIIQEYLTSRGFVRTK